MNTAIRAAAMLGLFLPACAGAQQELSFSTSVDLNYKRLSLQATQAVAGPIGSVTNTFQPTLWTLNVSPSLAWRGFFLSLGLERSLGESSTADYQAFSSTWSDRRYSREENNLTLGYNVWAGLSVFAGYLENSTIMNFTNYSVGASGLQNYGQTTYTEKGPYYGLGYSHRFASGGAVAVNYAYLKGRGTYETKQPVSVAFPLQEFNGDVTGSGFGLSWTAPLTGSLYYRLGYKGNRYTFDFTDQNGLARTTKQSYDSLYLGIATYF
jgi:hypothetical protein